MSNAERVDLAFLPIEQAVERFATDHLLSIDKCARGNAGWELSKPHDRGGDVTLLLLYDDVLGLGVGSVWQYPCPEMAKVYSHFRPMRACSIDPDAVIPALESELQTLSQIPFGYWTHLESLEPPHEDEA